MNDVKDNTQKDIKNAYHKRARLMLAIILTGVLAFFVLLEIMLRVEARTEQDAHNERFFNSTIYTLNNNIREVDRLKANFNDNNTIMLNNLVRAYSNDNYRKFSSMPGSVQSNLLAGSTESMEDCELLCIVNRDGDIIISDDPSENGKNIIEDKFLDIKASLFEDLCDGRRDSIVIDNPYCEDDEETGVSLYLYLRSIPGTYFTGGNKYILMGVASDIIDKAANGMIDFTTWLNGSTIGNNGSVLMVDSLANRVYYGAIDGISLDGINASSIGITSDMLKDRFSGICTINGTRCYASSRLYQSWLYGDSTYLIACIPTRDLYGGNYPVILWNLSLLLIFLVLLTAYSSYVRSELLRTGKDQLRIRLFKVKGKAIYYSRALGRKIIPIIFTTMLLIFASAFYIQSLMELSGAFSESVAIEEEISVNVEESEELQSEYMDYYNMQNASRAKLMAFIVALHGDEYFDFDNETEKVMTLSNADGTGNREVVKDDYNNIVNVINDSEALDRLKEENEMEDIYLISDAGYTLATSSDYWSLSLGTDANDKFYEFWDILEGRKDIIIGEPFINDEGRLLQIIGCAFNYYTRKDKDGSTEFVKYTEYIRQGSGDYAGEEITIHRGLLLMEMNPEVFETIIENAGPSYVLTNTRISNDGFLMGFSYDESEDDYKVFYSGLDFMTDRTASELDIPETAFLGNYNGFSTINGVRYLLSFRPAGTYYIATAMPSGRLYHNSFMTGVFCAIFGLALMFILSLYTLLIYDMDEWELAREESDPLAIFGHIETSKSWKNSTPSQKFELLIKRSLIISGTVFIAAIIYEAYKYGSNSAILYILSGGWDRGFNIFSVSAVLVLIIATGLFIKVFEHITGLIAAAFGSRVETRMRLFTSIIKAAVIIIMVFYCLFIMGIEATGLLASAGILSVVVGLGAQSLVSDLLAGIFIVMEGSLQVGDYITFDGVRGKVLDIGLRITRYEDDNQNIRIIANSALKTFSNMSVKYSVVYYNIPVPYNEDYKRIKDILNEEFLEMYENNRSLKGIPVCQGIEEFSESSVDLRVRFMCDESERYDVQRYMHDNIMRIFMENDISIPFNQLDVHYEISSSSLIDGENRV